MYVEGVAPPVPCPLVSMEDEPPAPTSEESFLEETSLGRRQTTGLGEPGVTCGGCLVHLADRSSQAGAVTGEDGTSEEDGMSTITKQRQPPVCGSLQSIYVVLTVRGVGTSGQETLHAEHGRGHV